MSLFYAHNELINTLSHLLPGVYFIVSLFEGVPCPYANNDGLADTWRVDKSVLQLYMASTAACLLFSVRIACLQLGIRGTAFPK